MATPETNHNRHAYKPLYRQAVAGHLKDPGIEKAEVTKDCLEYQAPKTAERQCFAKPQSMGWGESEISKALVALCIP